MKIRTLLTALFLAAAAHAASAGTASIVSDRSIFVSVPDQRLILTENGKVKAKYPISTSRFGVGDSWSSYRTPMGALRVIRKIGANAPAGAVFHHRQLTGEVLAPNAGGRDPIVTRIIWLGGMEAGNANAFQRGIYIHGTPVERLIGKPASYGCIRMRSQDVIALYDQIQSGTRVTVLAQSARTIIAQLRVPAPAAPVMIAATPAKSGKPAKTAKAVVKTAPKPAKKASGQIASTPGRDPRIVAL